MEGAPLIKAVDRRTVARICSGQVVVELAVAVKELVENSIDAGATSVEVRLRDHGTASIEVTDNGSGVSPENFEALVAKYHTSKLASFEALASVASFGFRGEALSSLCELAGSFTVVTRTRDAPTATRLTYDRAGTLQSREPAAHPVGTTVTVTGLFAPLPVRRQEFERSAKKQYAKMLRVLQGYAVIATTVRLSCSHTTSTGGGSGGGARSAVLSTQGSGRLSDHVANVFGAKFLASLVPLAVVDRGEEDRDDDNAHSPAVAAEASSSSSLSSSSSSSPPPTPPSPTAGAGAERRVEGLVSKAGAGVGRSDNDRQFFYLNGRPVDLPALARVVNEVWRCYEMKHKPAVFLNVVSAPYF